MLLKLNLKILKKFAVKNKKKKFNRWKTNRRYYTTDLKEMSKIPTTQFKLVIKI